jgi:chloride channel protein, CIC family
VTAGEVRAGEGTGPSSAGVGRPTRGASDAGARALQQSNTGSLADLSRRFWLLAVLTGIGAGVGAILMMAVLRSVQHVAFSYNSGEYSAAAARHGDLRRVAVLAVGGVVTGLGLWIMRRFLGGTGGQPTAVVWSRRGRLSLPLTTASGILSELSIGLGGSLGRENAPQHFGAAFGAWISERCRLPEEQHALLIACGAGAGVGAVYNVPFAGALFAAELYFGSISLGTVVPALLTAAIASAVGWITLPMGPIYHLPQVGYPSPSLLAWALVVGPLIGIAAAGWVKLVGWANDRKPSGRALVVGPPIAFTLLGVLAIQYPLLLGNGRDLTQFAFTGAGALTTIAALTVLKPLVTALCLRSGAIGGLFTPTMSTGAVLGALLGHAWALLFPGTPLASYAIVGSAAMLAAGMRTPVAAIAFATELPNSANPAILAMLLALGGAMLTARQLDKRSIYSARLPAPHQADDDRPRPVCPNARRARNDVGRDRYGQDAEALAKRPAATRAPRRAGPSMRP